MSIKENNEKYFSKLSQLFDIEIRYYEDRKYFDIFKNNNHIITFHSDIEKTETERDLTECILTLYRNKEI